MTRPRRRKTAKPSQRPIISVTRARVSAVGRNPGGALCFQAWSESHKGSSNGVRQIAHESLQTHWLEMKQLCAVSREIEVKPLSLQVLAESFVTLVAKQVRHVPVMFRQIIDFQWRIALA